MEKIKHFYNSKPTIVWIIIVSNTTLIIKFFSDKHTNECSKEINIFAIYLLIALFLLLINTLILIDSTFSTKITNSGSSSIVV